MTGMPQGGFQCLPNPTTRAPAQGISIVAKIIASQARKGNILEIDGNLAVVLKAESFRPGKGTPTTQIDLRRLDNGVKITHSYKTTDQVERAFVEDNDYTYLYKDGEQFIFMNPVSFEQLIVSSDVIGDSEPYLQENMTLKLSIYQEQAVGMELPQRMTFEIVETEPVTKGQTASSSYKPAMLNNGLRTLVPPHITAGTRIVVMTEDGSYVERAKD
jgi:elongation factor P